MNSSCSSSHGGSKRRRDKVVQVLVIPGIRPNNRAVNWQVCRRNVTEYKVSVTMKQSSFETLREMFGKIDRHIDPLGHVRPIPKGKNT